jgi:hypothetical protein
MLFDSVSRAFVVAQSDEFEMPAMIAFSQIQEPDLEPRVQAGPKLH